MLLSSPLVFFQLMVQSECLQCAWVSNQAVKACLSSIGASLGKPSMESEVEACLASSCTFLKIKCALILECDSTSYVVSFSVWSRACIFCSVVSSLSCCLFFSLLSSSLISSKVKFDSLSSSGSSGLCFSEVSELKPQLLDLVLCCCGGIFKGVFVPSPRTGERTVICSNLCSVRAIQMAYLCSCWMLRSHPGLLFLQVYHWSHLRILPFWGLIFPLSLHCLVRIIVIVILFWHVPLPVLLLFLFFLLVLYFGLSIFLWSAALVSSPFATSHGSK